MHNKYVDEYIRSTYNINDDEGIEIDNIDASELICKNRLDIIAKMIYIESKELGIEYGKEVYKEHIRAVTKDSFIESGNLGKNSIEKFEAEFNKVIDSIKNNGYLEEMYPIPVDKNLQILDGAHRVSAAIYYNKKIKIVKLPVEACDIYDYKFFENRGFSQCDMDYIVQKYIEKKSNVYIINIWPSAKGKRDEIESIINEFSNIIYYKSISLTEQGAFNYLHQIYSKDSWIGNVDNKFSGVYRKLEPCFKNKERVKMYVVEAKDLEDILKIKSNIRKLFNIGKHSIHITDTHDEAVSMGRLLLNDNSIQFMNYAKPYKYKKSYKMLKRYKNMVSYDNAITSSMVLAIHGIREASDIDIITLDEESLQNCDSHNYLYKYYRKSIKELIKSPKNYFYYDDIKLLTLDNIIEFKRNRNESKDKDDLVLIENYLKLSEGKKGITFLYSDVLRLKRRLVAKIQGSIIKVAHATGTYNILRNIKRILIN